MKRIFKRLGYGFLSWLVPFFLAFFIYPLKQAQSLLFEPFLILILTMTVLGLSLMYFRKISSDFLREGFLLGVNCYIISLLLNMPLFLVAGPLKMALGDYFSILGITYLIYPMITTVFGYAQGRKNK